MEIGQNMSMAQAYPFLLTLCPNQVNRRIMAKSQNLSWLFMFLTLKISFTQAAYFPSGPPRMFPDLADEEAASPKTIDR